jgi:hypothetical protein
MATTKRKKLVWYTAAALGAVVAWNAIALQAEVVVLRHMIHDHKVVYVIQGARPGTMWALGDTGCAVATRAETVVGSAPYLGPNFFTRDGRHITFIELDGVHPAGWLRFAVETGWQSGGLWGEWDEHTVLWDLRGWHYGGKAVTASS